MAKENDVQLIHRILSGDDNAFSLLVQKYQKGIHALAWRKVRDFHFAEEIVQDALLQAYQNLPTLRDHRRFAGWLYVITNRCCINWIRKNNIKTQSLEDTPIGEIDRLSYEHHVSEQYDVETAERSEAIVKTLLKKLPESEYTVVTLYYLSGMTTKEIGKFLGVSVNTITSRLQRARKRLQKEEELLISEILGSFQLPVDLTESIMRRVADMKLEPPSVGKPLLPWVAFGTATLLTVLLLGASNQYLARFQKPYSFEAQSEPTIEIVDTAIVLDIDSKPDVRNQAGRTVSDDRSSNTSMQASPTIVASDAQGNSLRASTSRWTQANGPQGGQVFDVFATPERTLYTVTPTGIYRLTPDETAWTLVDTNIPVGNLRMPMAEHGDTLYIVSTDAVFASTDSGETWDTLAPCPKGTPIGLIITDAPEGNGTHADFTMYLTLQDKGIFRSTDAGAQWVHLNNGLTDKRIYAVAAVGNTVFAGTNEDLYRLNSDVWEPLSVDASSAIHSLGVFKNNLYVATGPDLFTPRPIESASENARQIVRLDASSLSRIFHSNDLGESWTEITPKSKSLLLKPPTATRLLVTGETLLVQNIEQFRSTDGGQAWTNLGFDTNRLMLSSFRSVAVNENTFYKVDTFGIQRTTDGGDSWHPFMEGIVGTRMWDLVALNNRFYVHTGTDIVQSTDSGESWNSVQIDLNSTKKEQSGINFSFDAKLAVAAGGLYGIAPEKDNLRIFRLSTDGDMLISVEGMPAFDGETRSIELLTDIEAITPISFSNNTEQEDKLAAMSRTMETFAKAGGFAVSGETFYVEYKRMLFKWKPGNLEWANTGLIDTGEDLDDEFDRGFKLAVSGETVYVGKRDGKLFQSLDAGNSWRDITSNPPLRFIHFKEIRFAGATVYVATDTGVVTSQTGEHWSVVTDKMGERIVIDRFAVDSTTIYGAGDAGVYRLDDRGRWEHISPNIPDKIISLVVSNDRLYIATQQRGMFHISLEGEL